MRKNGPSLLKLVHTRKGISSTIVAVGTLQVFMCSPVLEEPDTEIYRPEYLILVFLVS